MYVLRIAVMITLSLIFLMASACCGFFLFSTEAKGFVVPAVLFFAIFLVLVREAWRSLLKGDT